jgi:alpha-galactosidase
MSVGVLFAAVLLCGSALALDNGAGLRPPMGWSSWCTEGSCGRDYCDETEVQAMANTMLSNGMHSLGWNFIVLDDCWAYDRDPATGQLTWDPERFPSGMPALTQWLHDRNFSFGRFCCRGDFFFFFLL